MVNKVQLRIKPVPPDLQSVESVTSTQGNLLDKQTRGFRAFLLKWVTKPFRWLLTREHRRTLKTIEAQRQESEQHYRTLIETIPQLVWIAEADGLNTTSFNQRWFDYTGQTPEISTGNNWLSTVHPEDVGRVLKCWQNAVSTQTDYESEYRLRRADGVYVWHLAKAAPVRNQQGQIIRWCGTCTDISERKQNEVDRQQAEAALRQLNETLEMRVKSRTEELVATVEALQREIKERQQAEAELKESEKRFRRAIAEAPFPIIIHSENGEILQMSQAALDITGYAASEIRTLNDWTKRAYGETQGDVLAGINRLYSLDKRIDEGEFEVRTKCGVIRTWLFSSAPLGRLRNGVRLVISMAADVTTQKRTEVALAIRLGQQAAITQLSQAALSGLDLKALFDQATQLVAHSLDVEYCKVLELLSDNQSLLLQSGVGWKSGLIGQAIVGADRNSQAGYTLLSQNAVIVQDLRTETRFNGPALLTDHGVVSGMSTIIQGDSDRPFGVIGAHSKRCRHFTQDDVNFLQSVANLLATAIRRRQAEQALQQLNFNLEQHVQDRTRALEAANQELEAFSYSVAHDLRAPLRAIQGFARVLEEDYGKALDDLGTEYVHRMANSAERMDLLIQDLLTYSRLGRTDINLQAVSLAVAVEGVLKDLEQTLHDQHAQVEVDPDLPTVFAQRSVLRQVLDNIIGNALKFVFPGIPPRIRIWAETCDRQKSNSGTNPQWVRVWIEDNGIGIAPHHRARIFNPFERLHGMEAYPGTGIGLSIVKRGVQRMGGHVGVESIVDQGSRFWLELKSKP